MANSSSALAGIENDTQHYKRDTRPLGIENDTQQPKGTALALTGIENDTQQPKGNYFHAH